MTLYAGPLDRRLRIERAATLGRTGFNEPVEAWVELATVWAARRDVGDAERVRAAELGAEIATRFQIRFSPRVADVTPRDRCVCDGVVFAITAVKQLGLREGLEITAAARSDLR